jgi:hypothetical protein
MQHDAHPDTPHHEPPRAPDAPASFHPSEADINALIATAAQQTAGLDFLLRGHLGTVAITFGTHAFTVVAARERLLKAAPGERPA